MSYIRKAAISETHAGRRVTEKRRMFRRRQRLRCALSLALIAIMIFGICRTVSCILDRNDKSKNNGTKTGKSEGVDKTDINNSDNDAAQDCNSTIKSDTLNQLEALAKKNSDIEAIVQNAHAYPESLLELLANNQETLSFVQNYPNRKSNAISPSLTKDDITGKIPLFLQWDKRWGYDPYGKDMLAITGCGPTCLSMVIVGLTGDLSANPGAIASFSQANGYCIDNNGTDWGLMTSGAENYGLKATEVPLWENSIINQLQAGHPLICVMGPGVFTTTGHYIVIYGYKNGEYLINDPNNIARSKQRWKYDSFENQIRNLWAYSVK